MNFVLFHIGNELPSHLKYCVKQIQCTNPNIPIYLLTNLNVVEPSIKTININTLEVPDIGLYYLKDPDPLWRASMLRIFYIESLMKKHDMENVIHFDNDVLIYENVDNIKSSLQSMGMAMTPHNETEYVFGFSFIKNAINLKKITNDILNLVLLGEKTLEPIVKTMPHEMRLLGYVNELNNGGLIDPLPIYPDRKYYDLFGYCFDPSTYGQVLGGAKPGDNHYIGRKFLKNESHVKLENKKPVLYIGDKQHKIFNLHIHNKRLHEFV